MLLHVTLRFCGPAVIALGLTPAVTTPVPSNAFVLSLAVTVNGLVHTCDYRYEKSLAHDSDIVALLATEPDGARIQQISAALGVRNTDAAHCLLRLLHKNLITRTDETAPMAERLFRLAA